jgi:hypothetical protein
MGCQKQPLKSVTRDGRQQPDMLSFVTGDFKMFASKKASIPEIEAPPSAAAIAAGVKRSGAHQSLVLRIQKLQGERQAAIDEIRALIAANSNQMNDKTINRLAKTCEAVEDKLRPLQMEVRGHRDEHSTRVHEALAPQIESGARMMVAALAEFNAAVNVINAAETEIERAGGAADFIRLPLEVGSLENYARGLAGQLGEKS